MDAAAVTAITSKVDFATIVTGLGAIGGSLVVIAVAGLGVRKLLSAIR